MADPLDWQLELDGLVLGAGTPYRLYAFDAEKPETQAGDVQRAAADGIDFGRDYLSGTVITMEFGVYSGTPGSADVRTLVKAMRRAWQGDAVRTTPGALMALRYKLPGDDTYIAYGRPRRFTPSSMETAEAGYIPVTCDFQCVGAKFYSDTETVLGLDLIPDRTGGLRPPFRPPVYLAPGAERSDAVANEGDVATEPIVTIYGPKDNPGWGYTGGLSTYVAASIPDGGAVTWDTRPWVQSITRDDGSSLAGAARGARLGDMTMAPGPVVVRFFGTDSDNSGSCEIRFRHARTTL